MVTPTFEFFTVAPSPSSGSGSYWVNTFFEEIEKRATFKKSASANSGTSRGLGRQSGAVDPFHDGVCRTIVSDALGENGCSEQVPSLMSPILGMRGVVSRAPPEAEPESGVQGQVAYLGGGTPLGYANEQVPPGGSWGPWGDCRTRPWVVTPPVGSCPPAPSGFG